MICGALWNFSQGAKKVQRHVISGDAQLIHDLAGPQGLDDWVKECTKSCSS
jgi:hypothetical protein